MNTLLKPIRLDLTELYRASSLLVQVSPDNSLIATAVDHRLVVRDADTLQIVQLFACTANIDLVSWAADSQLILVASKQKKAIQVFCHKVWSMANIDWKCCIDEGIAGVANVLWAPDARHLLVFSDFQLRITVWSLLTKEASYIQYPKYANKGYCFRKDGRYFALSERKDCRDTVSIYDCDDWTLIKHFPVETADLEDISWSPDGRFIAVWDSLLEYKLLVYSPDGRLVNSFSAYDSGLGIKTVSWSPSAQFIAVGSFDEKLRLINNMTWKPLIELSHPTNLPYSDIDVYKEIHISNRANDSRAKIWDPSGNLHSESEYELVRPPISVPTVRVDIEKVGSPKFGVGICEFNCDGQFVATRNDNMPNVLWIWDLTSLSQIALIQQLTVIKQIAWNPLRPGVCALNCTNNYAYLWNYQSAPDRESSSMCSAIAVPAINFQITHIKWTPDGRSLVLMDRDKFCLAFIVED